MTAGMRGGGRRNIYDKSFPAGEARREGALRGFTDSFSANYKWKLLQLLNIDFPGRGGIMGNTKRGYIDCLREERENVRQQR